MGRAEGTNPRALGTNLRARRGDPPTPGEKQAEAVAATKDRYLKALDWAKRNVPGEHGPFAASAATTLRHSLGRWPEPDQVRERLREQRRDSISLEGKKRARDILKDVPG